MSFAQDLRASVLQAAMQGKLTEQLKTDTPVDKSAVNVKKNKNMEDVDFDIPDGWLTGTIESISEILSSKKYQILDSEVLKSGKYPVISQSKEYSIGFCNDKSKVLSVETPVIAFGDHTTIVKYIDFDFVIGADGVKVFQPSSIVDCKYFYYVMTYLCHNLSNVGGYTRHYKFIKNKALPLPPIEEQKRIVRRLEEIMIRIDELEAIEEDLKKLKEVFPADMKTAVLQAAMQGKLTEQLETDSSVDDLLENIKKERERLVAEGNIKKSRTPQNDNFVQFSGEDMPFEIPDNWRWVKLGRITYNHGQKTPDKSFSYIDIGSINNEKQTLNVAETIIEPEKAPSRARKIVNTDDILYSTVRPYLHNMCIVNKSFSAEPIASTGFAVMKCNTGIYNKYLFFYLMSPQFDLYANATDNSKGVAYPAINDEKLFSAYIPIPPLEEQNRIVAKLEQILPLISDLS